MSLEKDRDEPKHGKPSHTETFDITGKKKLANYVGRFEDLYRQRDAVSADLKQLADDAREDMLSKREIEAVKKIAKWRVDDKLGAAQELFAAMSRVASAIKVDLFTWVNGKSKDGDAAH